jgi:hypothetical protein
MTAQVLPWTINGVMAGYRVVKYVQNEPHQLKVFTIPVDEPNNIDQAKDSAKRWCENFNAGRFDQLEGYLRGK